MEKYEFKKLEKENNNSNSNMELLNDIPLHITATIGECEMKVSDILNLGVGSIIELNKMINEPVSIKIDDKEFAKGEVVSIDDKFAIRLTEIIKKEGKK